MQNAQPLDAQAETCPGGGYNPTPTAVEVDAVPIVATSTIDDYFVLYTSHDVDGTDVEIPVLVKRGEAGTTTLAENVAALPIKRYRVEKHLIADPADVDGDCIDDITELDDLGSMNPVNRAGSLELTDGAVVIPDQETFESLGFANGGGVVDVKFVLFGFNTESPRVCFLNYNTYPGRAAFLKDVLGDGGLEQNVLQAIRGDLTYYPNLEAADGSLGVYVASDSITYTFGEVERLYTVIAASIPLLEQDLAYHLYNYQLLPIQDELPLYEASRIPLVFEEGIAPEEDFIPLSEEVGFGLLRVLEPDERPSLRDVVIYETLPNNLPRVAGIIPTVPQTPLSHVNLRAIQNGVPNAFIRDALQDDDIDALIDGYVRYQVTETEHAIRAATKAEVDAHYESSRPDTPQTPQRDLSVTEITPLSDIGFDYWDAFGVKAANVAVLGKLDFPEGTVPDGFAIPFYFYDEFMKHNDFYTRIETMLADTDFQENFDTQEDELKDLRKDIEDAETPEWIIDALAEMNEGFPEGINRRYRSSTNNEDLPGFNGAGLYDSKSQKPSEDEDDLAKSLKEVYASLWNFRAFTERDFHRIDHLAAAMGVLVHPSYKDELVNGVAVSFDPIGGWEGNHYVNCQVGEDLVTNPDAHSVPEELLLSSAGYVDVLVTSNQVSPGELLMSKDQMVQLRTRLEVIHNHFAGLYNPASAEPFAMEIEFKVTSEDILAIKQARPWVFNDSPTSPPPPPPPPPPQRPRPPSGGGGGGGGPQNRSPEFSDGSTTDRSVAENTPAGANNGDPVAATDREDDTLTYSLRGVDAESFDIDPATGQLLTKAPLDHEAKASYSVIVSVSDGKSSSDRDSDARDDSITVAIDVENVDEPGAVALSSHQPQVDVALTARRRGLARVSWLWERSADQADWTEIDGAGTGSYTPVIGDLSSYLRVTASYTDGHGRGKSAGAVTGDPVLINTVPRFPGVDAGGGIAIEVEEGSGDAESGGIGEPVAAADPDGDTLTYSLGGENAGSFEIDASTGQLWSRAPLDYETQAAHSLVVSVRDSRDFNGDPDTAVDASVTVTIVVVNVGEPGTLTLLSSEPRVGVPFAARLTDPDGVVGEVVWKWERSRDGNPWSSSWRTIGGAESGAYAPVDADLGYYLRITASYEDGHGPGKSRQAISEGRVMENTGPVFSEAPDGVLERSVAENAGAGEPVGDPVAATSPDGGALTYALGGADAALFVIDAGTGQIRVGAGTALDYEAAKNVYEVTVTAADSSGASATVAVTITVTNVELPGMANDYDADKNEAIDRDEALATVVDYFSGVITQEEALEVVRLYFAG